MCRYVRVNYVRKLCTYAPLTAPDHGRESAAQIRKRQQQEAAMPLTFMGIDPDSEQGDSPTVWADTDNQELLIQGWRATEGEIHRCYAEGGTAPGHATGVPEGETIIRIPARMAPILREALDAFDRSIDH
jgi:hypothetical protein